MLYHPVRKRILQLVQSTLITRQILTHVRLVLVSSVWDHHLILGPADYGREDKGLLLLSAEAHLHESAAIIDDDWRLEE